MTLIYEFNLDVLKTFKNEHFGSRHSKFGAQTGHRNTLICFYDLDLDSMTLTYELNLDILKLYLHTKTELSRSRLSKVRALQTKNITIPHLPVMVR